jgi:hypothetical protein
VTMDADPHPEGRHVLYHETLGGLGLPPYPVDGVIHARYATPEERTLCLPIFAGIDMGGERTRLWRAHQCRRGVRR